MSRPRFPQFIFVTAVASVILSIFVFHTVFAAGNIDPVNRYAYGELVGWIDF